MAGTAAEAAQQAAQALNNGHGVDTSTRVVAFHPNSLAKGFMATGVAFVALAFAQKKFRDAFIEGLEVVQS
jgi:hypothetical protein